MTDTIAVSIPDNLQTFDAGKTRDLARRQGLTFNDLGTRCGRSAAAIRDYLTGRSDPPAAMVAALAMVLDVAPGDLFRPVTKEDVEARVAVMATVAAVRPVPRRARLRRS
jgi:transcriptional regulator with XRE-family HTH domain